MKKIMLERYEFPTSKLKNRKQIRIHVISDLHGDLELKDVPVFLEKIRKRNPDLILIPGDLITGIFDQTYVVGRALLKELVKMAPVYYSYGNHESKAELNEQYGPVVRDFLSDAKEMGVHVLRNEAESAKICGEEFRFYGLEMDMEYYKRPNAPWPKDGFLDELFERDEDAYEILLAHNPRYGSYYLEWGIDLTVSGHYHGGVMRLGKRKGALSPQFEILPEYCCGDFYFEDSHLVVSAGLGEHTIPFRIMNPRTVVEINLKKSEN